MCNIYIAIIINWSLLKRLYIYGIYIIIYISFFVFIYIYIPKFRGASPTEGEGQGLAMCIYIGLPNRRLLYKLPYIIQHILTNLEDARAKSECQPDPVCDEVKWVWWDGVLGVHEQHYSHSTC